jgi:hypothetical protein
MDRFLHVHGIARTADRIHPRTSCRAVSMVLLIFALALDNDHLLRKQGPQTTYVAVGASETLGFGLSPGMAYPRLLAKACGVRPIVRAQPWVPALRETMVPPQGPYLLSLFIGTNDLTLQPPAFRTLLRAARPLLYLARRADVILAPPLSEIPAGVGAPRSLVERQINYDSLVLATAAGHARVTIKQLHVTASERSKLIQPDGIHPSVLGQRRIADLVRLGLQLKCSAL